jgi:Core binding factor beta subunit
MMNMNMNMINDPALAGMLPFDTMGLYEPPKPRYIFKMPRVVPDQKEKFESDDLFKKLSRDSEVSRHSIDPQVPNAN